jgi:hypothetical protein
MFILRNTNILPSITALTNMAMTFVGQPPNAKVFIPMGTGNMATVYGAPDDTTGAASSGTPSAASVSSSGSASSSGSTSSISPSRAAGGGGLGGIAAGIAPELGSLFGRGEHNHHHHHHHQHHHHQDYNRDFGTAIKARGHHYHKGIEEALIGAALDDRGNHHHHQHHKGDVAAVLKDRGHHHHKGIEIALIGAALNNRGRHHRHHNEHKGRTPAAR